MDSVHGRVIRQLELCARFGYLPYMVRLKNLETMMLARSAYRRSRGRTVDRIYKGHSVSSERIVQSWVLTRYLHWNTRSGCTARSPTRTGTSQTNRTICLPLSDVLTESPTFKSSTVAEIPGAHTRYST